MLLTEVRPLTSFLNTMHGRLCAMLNSLSNLPETLLAHPEAENLKKFVERVLSERGDEIAFIVVFGSAAKGNWTVRSDLDVFIGLSVDDGLRLIDRIGQFADLAEGNLEVFPYARSEWKRMFDSLHPLLLEVLEDGIVLFDKGDFAAMREIFRKWRSDGLVIRNQFGWRILLEQKANSLSQLHQSDDANCR
jgi:predicted nucleotidyltransferase